MVAAVLVGRPQKVWAPWRASSIRSVISLKVVSIRLRHSAMTFSKMAGMAGRWRLSSGGGGDGGAAGGQLRFEGPAAEALVREQVARGRPGFQQVDRDVALADGG